MIIVCLLWRLSGECASGCPDQRLFEADTLKLCWWWEIRQRLSPNTPQVFVCWCLCRMSPWRFFPPVVLLGPVQTVLLSVFMLQLLRTAARRASSSMASDTYTSATHSAAFVTCPNDTVAKDLARWPAAILSKIKPVCTILNKICPSLSHTHTEVLWRRSWLPVSTLSQPLNQCKLVCTTDDPKYCMMLVRQLLICARPPDTSGREKLKRTVRSCWLVCSEIFGMTSRHPVSDTSFNPVASERLLNSV